MLSKRYGYGSEKTAPPGVCVLGVFCGEEKNFLLSRKSSEKILLIYEKSAGFHISSDDICRSKSRKNSWLKSMWVEKHAGRKSMWVEKHGVEKACGSKSMWG